VTPSDELAFPLEAFLAAGMAQLGAGFGGDPRLQSFLGQYLADAFREDFAGVTIEDAARLALDLWTFNDTHAAAPVRQVRVRPATGATGAPLGFDVVEIVGPDMAFLVDSTIAACQESRLDVRALLHPVIETPAGLRSLIQVHLPAGAASVRGALEDRFRSAMADVERVNADFQPMRARMHAASQTLSDLVARNSTTAGDFREGAAFLDWLADRFTFLGVRDYAFPSGPGGEAIMGEPIVEAASGLGILRDPERRVLSRTSEPTVLTPSIRAFLDEPSPVIVAKTSFISRVHRRVHADYVGVKRYDDAGRVVGETRFAGLFTSDAYTDAADSVPLIRRKISAVKAAFARQSRFSEKQLDAVLKSFPRDELFQASVEDLTRIAKGGLRLLVRPGTRLFIRRDRFDRYVSALLYTPRDSFSSDLRARAHRIIADAYGGRTTAYFPSYGEGPLARVHLIVGLDAGHPEPDEAALDRAMQELFRSWDDSFLDAAQAGGADLQLAASARFSAAYREAFGPEEALVDLSAIAAMPAAGAVRVRVRPDQPADGALRRLKIYHRGGPLELSAIVPVLERMGQYVQVEVPYPVRFSGADGSRGDIIYIHDLAVTRPVGDGVLDERFEGAFEAVWARETENDSFNSLVAALGVDWRAAALFRTLARWRSQSGLDPSESVQVRALLDHPAIARTLLDLFAARFDPDGPDDMAARREICDRLGAEARAGLESVASLDADRVLRRILSLIQSIQRTSYYLRDATGRADRHISIKIASREAEALPEPRPYREIFVCSPDVEGVHLRFGPVARGGLRWSDRRDDFRTEVLGLVKAQQVKNAVIVPVGAKGGFFPKALPAGGGREAIQSAGVAAYKVFVGALLQITDNLVDGKPVRDPRLVAWDGDDPYLVVAADKGTATFSDIANGLSQAHRFWLDDAFASGGSQGYDHKKMGITARGAWEAVKRHFREMGRDTQTEPFTVIGVGDMSGDVFGNGMLLSKTIRLLAAFDHRHIFIDPDPADPAASWAERQRLFDLPRSSWADYDRARISKGGGVFERSLKAIPLSAEMQGLSGLTQASVTPAELMKALLKSEVDLLWFGGIGGFIKAGLQSHADVGDKANDAIRIDAREVRAKVIAEGANLGLTQAARIEFARRGGRINTDAIDNSAGVATSDREVNIKILLTDAIATRALAAADRNALLETMTEDVGHLVLRDNYDQTGALSVMQLSAAADIDAHESFVDQMEAAGKLDRKVEGLPSTEEFRARRDAREGLTRPELAVLMAYAKLDLFAQLIASPAPDDPAMEPLLVSYFPDELGRFSDSRNRHRLKREIIATRLANRIVNLTGPAFAASQIAAGLPPARLAQGFEAAYAIFGLSGLLGRMEAMDGKTPALAQTRLKSEVSANLRLLAMSFASDPHLAQGGSIASLVRRYGATIPQVARLLPEVISPFVLARVGARAEAYRSAGAPADLALDVAMMRPLASAREAVDIAERSGWPLESASRVQHAVGLRLGVDRMRAASRDLEPTDHWERQALLRVADDLPRQQTEIACAIIAAAGRQGLSTSQIDAGAASDLVETWMSARRDLSDRVSVPAAGFDKAGGWSLAKLVLMGDALREFVYAVRAETPETAGAAKGPDRA
jgi:glutamate dehydrogenase